METKLENPFRALASFKESQAHYAISSAVTTKPVPSYLVQGCQCRKIKGRKTWCGLKTELQGSLLLTTHGCTSLMTEPPETNLSVVNI